MKASTLPEKDDFEQNYILKSFNSKVTDRNRLPIIVYLKRYNNKKQVADVIVDVIVATDTDVVIATDTPVPLLEMTVIKKVLSERKI